MSIDISDIRPNLWSASFSTQDNQSLENGHSEEIPVEDTTNTLDKKEDQVLTDPLLITDDPGDFGNEGYQQESDGSNGDDLSIDLELQHTDDEEDDTEFEDLGTLLAKQLKEDGFISEEFEVKEGLTAQEVYQEYKKTNESKLAAELAQALEEKLTLAGINERNIMVLQAIENQVPIDELYEYDKIRKFATLEEISTEDSDKILTEYYKQRDWSKDEIEERLENIDISGKRDVEEKKAQEFFKNKVSSFDEEQRKISEQRIARQQQIVEYNKRVLAKAVNDKELAGEKLSPSEANKILEAVQRRDIYEVDGQKVEATEIEIFKYQLDNDFEKLLEAFKYVRFREQERDKIKKEAASEEDRKLEEALKKARKNERLNKSLKKSDLNTDKPFKDSNNNFMVFTSNFGKY